MINWDKYNNINIIIVPYFKGDAHASEKSEGSSSVTLSSSGCSERSGVYSDTLPLGGLYFETMNEPKSNNAPNGMIVMIILKKIKKIKNKIPRKKKLKWTVLQSIL